MAVCDLPAGAILRQPFASSTQALLELCQSLASRRGVPALICGLKKRMPHLVHLTFVCLALGEPVRNKMRRHVIATPERMDVDAIEDDVRDSPRGFVWQTQFFALSKLTSIQRSSIVSAADRCSLRSSYLTQSN